MTTKSKTAKAPAAKVRERLTDLALSDALSRMKRRCYGLESAVNSIAADGERIEVGVAKLASDLSDESAHPEPRATSTSCRQTTPKRPCGAS
jgi:hypothetical protein